MKKDNKKLVLFGAGKIGRSFVGQIFSRAGYEVVFVDVNQELVDNLNRAKSYKVVTQSNEATEIIEVENVRGINIYDHDAVVAELSDASIAALSVGQMGLPSAIPVIAKGLLMRRQKFGHWPLDIIIAENMRNADKYLFNALSWHLPSDYPVCMLIGLVETSIGKMVPFMTRKDSKEDPLQVFAEPYNDLIVSKKGFKNPIPDVAFLFPKENIKAWVDRKLFIHNLGHAAAAYLGHLKYPNAIYLYEVLNSVDVFEATQKAMLQSARILMVLYPGEFTQMQLGEHIDDLLARFKNSSLKDTIFRVGCDLYRKLGPNDRLAGPIHAAVELNMPYNYILDVIKASLNFRASDENGRFFPGDEHFFVEAEKGFDYILSSVCRLNLHK